MATALSHKLDVIALAAEMPGMSGLDTAGEIRRGEAEVGHRAYIVGVLSDACAATGMDAQVGKPMTEADLARQIKRSGIVAMAAA